MATTVESPAAPLPAPTAATPRRRRPFSSAAPGLGRHLVLVVASVLFFGPFLWMVLVSF